MALFLLAQISPSIRCSLGNRIITNISDATSVLVHAQANAGKDRVCELVHELEPESEDFSVAGVTFRPVTTHFVFQNVKYEFDEEKNTFAQVVYPTSSTLGSYCSHTGHESKESVLTAFNKWGRNEFEIPMPEFVDLYMVRIGSYTIYYKISNIEHFLFVISAGKFGCTLFHIPNIVPLIVVPG
jgi:cation-transporting ATPase 13A1